MKSILALLAIIVVANAYIPSGKLGGLKGSWTDQIEVDSASEDLTAPVITYDADVSQALYMTYISDFNTAKTINLTEECLDNGYNLYSCNNGYYSSSDYYLNFRFAITGELDYSVATYSDETFAMSGKVWVTYWSGTDMTAPDASFDMTCTVSYSDNSVTCGYLLAAHMMPGVYKPYITAVDTNGNWASADETAFDDVEDMVVLTIEEAFPDMNAPWFVGTPTVSATEVVLGTTTSVVDTSKFIEITAVAQDGANDDGTPTDSDDFDWLSSTMGGVMVTITWGEGDDMVTVNWDLVYQSYAVATGDQTWEARLTFFPVFEPGTWTITAITAWDLAGNTAVSALAATEIEVSFDDTTLEDNGGVFSCQTLDAYVDAFDLTAPLVVTGAVSNSFYVTAGCIEKEEANNNYVAVAFQTPDYNPDVDGEEGDERVKMYWSYGAGWDAGYGELSYSNFGQGVAYGWSDSDTTPSYAYPGTSFTIGIWGAYIYVSPAAIDGDYDLSEVYTITQEGGIQRYSLTEGSASSVAPSLLVAAVAAVVALLRL